MHYMGRTVGLDSTAEQDVLVMSCKTPGCGEKSKSRPYEMVLGWALSHSRRADHNAFELTATNHYTVVRDSSASPLGD